MLPQSTATLNCQIFSTESVVTFSPQSDTYRGDGGVWGGAALRKPNTSEKTATSSPARQRHTHRYPPRHARSPGKQTTNSAYQPGPQHAEQLNSDNPASPSVHPAVRAAGRSVWTSPAGNRHRGKEVRLGGSFETRARQQARAPSCGGKTRWRSFYFSVSFPLLQI